MVMEELYNDVVNDVIAEKSNGMEIIELEERRENSIYRKLIKNNIDKVLKLVDFFASIQVKCVKTN